MTLTKIYDELVDTVLSGADCDLMYDTKLEIDEDLLTATIYVPGATEWDLKTTLTPQFVEIKGSGYHKIFKMDTERISAFLSSTLAGGVLTMEFRLKNEP